MGMGFLLARMVSSFFARESVAILLFLDGLFFAILDC